MRPPALRTLCLALFLAAPSFTGCGAPRFGPVREVTKRASEILASAPSSYAPDAAKIPASGEDARVRATFENAVPPAAKGALRHEPALDLVARVTAEMLSAEKQPPSAAMMQWLFWRAGAVSRYARVEAMVVEGVDDLDLQMADAGTRMQAPVYPEAYGVARSTRGRGAQVVVFGRRLLDVDPFPKSAPPGAPLTLKVKPAEGFAELTLLADDADGKTSEARLAPAEGGAFTVTWTAPAKPGRYFVEITGLDPRTQSGTPENPWRRTLFLAPVYVGVPEPVAPDEAFTHPGPAVFDATSWAGHVIDGYNAARRAAGKQPAATDGRLATLARERVGVTAQAEREPPPDAVLADKIAAAGSPPHDYDVVEARLDSPADHVALRLLAPSARRRLIEAESPLLAVAVAPRPLRARGAAVEHALVEVAVTPVARLDPSRDRAKVHGALDAAAQAEGRAAYKHDEDVGKAVQQFADEVCRGGVRPNQMKLLVDKARGIGEKYKTWGTPVWRAGYDYTRWQEVSVLGKAKEAPLPYAEAGVCQGNLAGKPGGSYVVVLQYGP